MSLGSDGGVPAVMNVTPTGGTGYNNSGCGGDWGAWIILFLIFGMFGWGGFGGFGGGWGGNGGPAATQADIQRGFDTSSIISKLDSINSGLCDGFYAMNTGMLQGFNSVNQGLCNLGYQTQQGFNATQVALMQGFNSAQAQAAECCCQTQRAIDGVKFTIAQEDCATRNLMQSNTRDLIENQNANARAVLDALTAQRLEAKDERIAAQAAQIQALQLSASQAQQNAAIGAMISASEATILRRTGAECPAPAYVVQPPTPVNFPTNCCGQFSGWNNGCGCNSGCGC